MANRYWVGGSATWDATAGTKWALTSGGAGGEAVPTSSDDVFLDAASGAVTVTIGTASCKNFTCTGFTGTLAGNSNPLYIYGNMVLGAGMTCSFTQPFRFEATDAGHTVTTNGVSLVNIPRFGGLGGEWTLQDDLTTTNDVDLYLGTLNTNGKTVSCNNFYTDGTTNGVLNLGASHINVSSQFQIAASHPDFTFNCGTSTIHFIYSGASSVDIGSVGETYYNIWINTTGASVFRITDSNTFNNIKIEPGRTIYTSSGKIVTYTSLTATGTVGNLITFAKLGGSGYTWTKAGGGTVGNDYMSISYMTANPDVTFYAGTNSTNGGNNSQVYFTDVPQPNLITNGDTTFAVGDILRIKDGVDDEWMEVTSVQDSSNYFVTRDKAGVYGVNTNPVWTKGATVVNYGQSGDGGIYMTASDSNSPYLDIFTHTGSPWNTISTKVRLGYLKGITDADVGLNSTDTWGLYSDNAYLKGAVIATSGKFGTTTNYWSVGATGLTAVSASTDVILNYGKTDFGQDSTAGFILGYDFSATKAKFEIGSSTTKIFKYDGTDFTLIGGTITGGLIQTAASSSKVTLSVDGIKFYNSSDYNTAAIDTTGNFTIIPITDGAVYDLRKSTVNSNISRQPMDVSIRPVITDGSTYTVGAAMLQLLGYPPYCFGNSSFTGAGTTTILNIQDYPYTVTGTHYDFTGSNTAATAKSYKIQIDGVGSPNTFKWSDNGGVGWVASTVAITGADQTLTSADDSYIIVRFSSTTGAVIDDFWTMTSGATSAYTGNILDIGYQSDIASGNVINIINNGTGKDIDGHSSNWYAKSDGTINCAELQADGDIGGLANTNSLTGTSNLTANSTGVGTILFKGTGSRDSSGFIKVYIGTTAYYVPVFDSITG